MMMRDGDDDVGHWGSSTVWKQSTDCTRVVERGGFWKSYINWEVRPDLSSLCVTLRLEKLLFIFIHYDRRFLRIAEEVVCQ